MKTYLLIYHKEDNDGVVSAALVYDYLIRKLNCKANDIELLPSDYNTLSTLEKSTSVDTLVELYQTIIMVDISFNNTKYMKQLYNKFGKNIIWCDHHKPIIDDSFRQAFNDMQGVRCTSKSAILCTYEYLYDAFNVQYNEKQVPDIFRILSAWDSWSYEREGYDFEYVKNINKACTVRWELNFQTIVNEVRSIMTSFESNKDDFPIDDFYNYGKILNEYDDFTMKQIIQQNGDKDWKVSIYDEDRQRPLFINTCAIFNQGASNSTMFKSLKETNPTIEIGAVFKHQPNGNWTMSLYNVNNEYWFNCGEFLKQKYNGGGHKGAGGCTLTESQFIKILKSKVI